MLTTRLRESKATGRTLEFRVLGPLEVAAPEGLLRLGGPRQRALLAALLLDANRYVPRDRLVDALWGESPPETAVNALQVAVHGLRKVLGADRVLTGDAGYRLNVRPGELDLDRFEVLRERAAGERGASAVSTLRAALELWRGPALADLPGSARAESERARLEELRLATLERRFELELEAGGAEAVLAELQPLVGEHPFRERLRELQMLALYRTGRQADALEVYRRARATLVEELGVEPAPALQRLEAAILRQDPGLHPGGAAVSALPAPATRLIGRDLEVVAVSGLLREVDVRLVTLTGPGGTGKTRLALAVAAELAPEYADGVAFVDLAPLDDARHVPTAVARALGIEEAGDRSSAEALAEVLARRTTLLVLDNFERLVAAAGVVGDLLARAPGVKVLVTSRVLLRAYGEHEYPVPPLRLPDRSGSSSLESLARTEAVALYVARARAARNDFRLTDANAPAVVEICHALDGLPLALELAAARSRLLSPEELRDRLGQRLDLLTGGPRDADPRQQALRSTIDWSYRLLERDEQGIFARLSVFAGGCTLEAAEVVCEASPAQLEALLASSLLARGDGGGEPRLQMLETIREFGLEHLDEAGATDDVRRRHAAFFLELGERAEPELERGGHSVWLDRLEAEHDNLRAAMLWMLESEPGWARRLTGALYRYWTMRGHFAEGARWSRAVLAHAGGPAEERAKAYMAASHCVGIQGHLETARELAGAGLALYRGLGDEAGASRCLSFLAIISLLDGTEARAAAGLADEAVALLRGSDETQALAFAIGVRGDVSLQAGELERAGVLTREALDLRRRCGDTEQVGFALSNLAWIAVLQLRLAEARDLLAEGTAAFSELRHRWGLTDCLDAFAVVAGKEGDPERAARLLGAAEALRELTGVQREAIPQEQCRALAAVAAAELGAEEFARLVEEGRGMPTEAALAHALAR